MNIRLGSETKEPYINIENRHNNLQMTIPLPGRIKTLDGFLAYTPILIRQAPLYWQDMIRSIRDIPKRAIRYQHGDIVRVALDWKKFAFGLIIGKFSDYRKWGILPQNHPYTHIMTAPVILRFYDLIWDNPAPTLETLVKISLQDPIIVMDDTILRNTHPIILHKELTEEDILFPQHCNILYKSSNPEDNSIGYHIRDNEHLKHLMSLGYKPQLSLAWGFGMTTIHREELEQRLPPLEEYHWASNTGIGPLHITDKDSKPYFPYPDFARHPKQKEVFAYFGVATETTFDGFNSRFGGYTRSEYLKMLKEHGVR